MEKEENYSASLSGNFTSLDYTNHHAHHLMKTQIGEPTSSTDQQMVVDYNNSNMNMVHGIHHQHHHEPPQAMNMMMSFADVMQFADFGPKLGLINKTSSEEENIDDDDPVYFLKFPVLNHYQQHHNHDHDDAHHHDNHMRESELGNSNGKGGLLLHDDVDVVDDDDDDDVMIRGGSGGGGGGSAAVQLRILGENLEKNGDSSVAETNNNGNNKSKRKRPRSVKTSEEVESQRMTHIAVERNRRKQMNEHLRVLRSLMPGSYVQRGDQASIIGGAIEFVRELEQLLQCLESQKRRRLYGGDGGGGGRPPMAAEDSSSSSLPNIHQQPQPPPSFLIPPLGGQVVLPNDHQMKLVELETAGQQQQLREETAESKSCLADIEVKLLGFDAMIKILSRRRPGQLIKTIAALEDLQLNILHTNITTIEQTVLYSFNVKVAGEARVTAEDIANSVQQIFSFIHADTTNII